MPDVPASAEPGLRESVTDMHARAAVTVLKEVASKYNGYITYRTLQDEVAARTGRPTNQLADSWADSVLNKVIKHCTQQELPPLTALVVRASDGGVGKGFNEVLIKSGRDPISDQRQLEGCCCRGTAEVLSRVLS